MAKTKKKKISTDSVHIDINSHNASGKSKYKMLDEGRKITAKDIHDGCWFSYRGINYVIYQYDDNLVVHYDKGPNKGKVAGVICNVFKTGLCVSEYFWNKSVKTKIKFSEMFYIAGH